MSELTYEDIVAHYYLKIKEVLEEIERYQRTLMVSSETMDSIWKGSASVAFQEKSLEIRRNFEIIKTNLADTLKALEIISKQI